MMVESHLFVVVCLSLVLGFFFGFAFWVWFMEGR